MGRHPLRWWALTVAVLAVLVDMIDNQIVAVALPTIQRQLDTGEAALGLGFSPIAAALTFLPATIGIIAGNGLAMRMAPKYGRSFTATAIVVLLLSLASIATLVAWRGEALTT